MTIGKYGVHRSLTGLLFWSGLVVALGVNTSGVAGPPTTNALIVNTPSSPVATQNVGGGAATQVGQPVSNIVNLTCVYGIPIGCYQVIGDGLFAVPSGEALVITDVQFRLQSTTGTGNYNIATLLVDSVTGNQLLPLSGLTDANSIVLGQVHLGTGVVLPSGSGVSLRPFGSKDFAFVQGYLVPNQ
jgi:hypothetical protein